VLSNGQTGTFKPGSMTGLSFFGLTSTTAFNSVTIKVNSAITAYDNITYAPTLAGGVTATPEPATVGLMAMGLVGVGAFARKRRKA